MKIAITPNYVFTPATRTLSFAGFAGFNIRKLVAVINLTQGGTLIYCAGIAGLGYTGLAGGNVLTLAFNTTAHGAGDTLLIYYDQQPVFGPGEDHLGEVGGRSARVAASFARPASALVYAAGQLIANNAAAASVTALALPVARKAGGTGMVTAVKITKSGLSLANASFRAHLYRDAPTCANGDGGTWITTASRYLGYADVTMDKAFSDEASGVGVVKDAAGNARNLIFDTASGSQSIYALIEARAAYSAAAGETFGVVAEVLQD